MNANTPDDVAAQVATLWTDHHESIARRTAIRTGLNAEDHDVQEAIAAGFDRGLRYLQRGGIIEGHPGPWLATVVFNEYLRADGRRRRTTEVDYSDDVLERAADPNAGPEELALDGAHSTLDGALRRALGRLTPRQRAILLDVHAGYRYDEIADRHEVTTRTVNKQLTKARTKLRQDGELARAYREWSD